MVSAPTAVGVPFTRQEERRFAKEARGWELLSEFHGFSMDTDPADESNDPIQSHPEDWGREKLDDLGFVK